MPLNYYLKHNFKAPAPVPSNDLDIKVEFGDYMRSLLAERGGGPSTADKESWSEEEKAQFQACFDESLAMFVTYAKELMDALKAAAEAVIGKITSERKPLGIGIGPQAVHVYHKTHAAPRGARGARWHHPLAACERRAVAPALARPRRTALAARAPLD